MPHTQLSQEALDRIARNKAAALQRLQQSKVAKQPSQTAQLARPVTGIQQAPATNGPTAAGAGDAPADKPTSFQRKKRAIDLNYCEYNFSTMKDTKGGFIVEEQQIDLPEKKQKTDTEASVSDHTLDPDARCEACKSIDLDLNYWKHFNIYVCRACKDAVPDKYSLLTKTECREDYLLTESELRDTSRLPHWVRPNPHKNTYSNMLLYLRCQVEAFAWDKWGGPDQLDAEFDRREKEKKERKAKKFKAKLNELRKKTRTSTWTQRLETDHEHEYGEDEFDASSNQYVSVRRCVAVHKDMLNLWF
ncbi:hypothetical protein HK097_003762 [Rhizophlyctis rosea]|uniref:XPA C-terminal domain-containing protein n=1 Tax=Rhizophlyctis rosea TaxID=64517 RepID=A0AAD5SHS4_9FUNG|nr:hypothetical protein HK097_003762 [Rhizophlyctis rosea]